MTARAARWARWAAAAQARANFNLPSDAVVAPDGATLWVLDAGNFRVQAFDREGRFVRAFGSVGHNVGQFARPRGLAVDRDGLVYVSDAAFCNVQVFQGDGTMLLAIGGRAERISLAATCCRPSWRWTTADGSTWSTSFCTRWKSSAA